MKQFKTILKFELKDFLRDKFFVGITIFLVVAIAAVMFIPNIISLFSQEGEKEPVEKPVMLIMAEDKKLESFALPYFKASFTDYDVKSGEEETIEGLSNKIIGEEISCAFVLDSTNSYTYYVNNLSMYDQNTAKANEVLITVYRADAMLNAGLSAGEVIDILGKTVEFETVSLGKDQVMNFFYTYIMIFALYTVIMLYGQMIATSVATEKSSRAMELLVTSANPVSMMFGKVLAACIAGFTQLLLVFGSALLFYNVNKSAWGDNEIINSIFAFPPELLIYMLVFFLLGFFIYAFLYGAVGSTVSKLEEINTAVLPITFTFIIAFMVVMFSITGGSVDNIAMKICSFIPFTSPMAMFTRIAMSTVPTYEIIISILLLVASVIGVGILSAKIYRVGVLLYGTKPNLFKTIKSLFK